MFSPIRRVKATEKVLGHYRSGCSRCGMELSSTVQFYVEYDQRRHAAWHAACDAEKAMGSEVSA